MEKTKQKHPLVKRVLSTLLAASIAVGTFAANAFADGSDDRYDKAYTIGNILSDFQYFTKGDLKGSAHTVGAVAVGGTMDKGNSFGNGAVTPSFINKIDQATAAFGVYKFEGSNDVLYYVDGVEKLQNWGSSLKTVKSDGKYIDFDAAFTAVEKQSEALAAAGKTLSAADVSNGVINVDLSDDVKNITIPFSLFKTSNSLNLTENGMPINVEKFKNTAYTISVVGVGDETIGVNFNGGVGNLPGNAIKAISGGLEGDQLNLEGMKLIWNFPDAENIITMTSLGGHVVAPKGDVHVPGGNLEGGVIAASINDEGSEAHFYAYNELGYEPEKPDDSSSADSSSADSSAADSSADSSKADNSSAADTSSSADNSSASDTSSSDSSSNSDSSQPDKPDVKTTSVEFQKITDKNIALEGAVFGLYKDGICSVPVQKDGANYTFQSGADGIVRFEGLEAGTYYFKELQAPAGYEVNTKIYGVEVSFDASGKGTVTFIDGEQAGLNDLKVPNDPITAQTVKLTKTYENADIADLTTAQRDELAQATEFTLYADAELSDVIAAASPIVTNGKFSVSFNDGLSVPTEAGAFNIYYMAESKAPNGYKVSDSVYVCRIDNSGAVAYKLLGQSDAAYSAAIPECENKLDKTTGDSSAVDSSSQTDVVTSDTDNSSAADNSSVADTSSDADTSSVADTSSTNDTSSAANDSSAADNSSSSDSRDALESTSDNSSSADSSSVSDVTDSDAKQDSSSDADSSGSSASSAANPESNSGADSSASSAVSSSTGTGNSTSSSAAGSSSSSANGSGSSNNSNGNPNTGVKSTLGVSAVLIAAAAVCVRKNKNR